MAFQKGLLASFACPVRCIHDLTIVLWAVMPEVVINDLAAKIRIDSNRYASGLKQCRIILEGVAKMNVQMPTKMNHEGKKK
ncbi:MAG: hypothetical protein Q8K71_17425 [Polaromonas sp.]|nr:hypothetical protein [Polaromonas sp.]MDP3752119.1 hypothetical protein [Polaromonas sp.]